MRKYLRALPLLIVVMTMLAGARVVVADEVIDRVVAVVAGDLIMESDVNAVRTLGLSSTPRDLPDEEILNRLIDRTLVLSEIERYSPPEPAQAVIDAGVRAIRARFATDAAFDAAMARVGFSERRLRQTVRQDLRIDAYLQQRFTTPMPTDEEIAAYYEQHADRFAVGGRQLSLVEARDQVEDAIRRERHDRLVADWVSGLRRRASILRVTPPSGG